MLLSVEKESLPPAASRRQHRAEYGAVSTKPNSDANTTNSIDHGASNSPKKLNSDSNKCNDGEQNSKNLAFPSLLSLSDIRSLAEEVGLQEIGHSHSSKAVEFRWNGRSSSRNHNINASSTSITNTDEIIMQSSISESPRNANSNTNTNSTNTNSTNTNSLNSSTILSMTMSHLSIDDTTSAVPQYNPYNHLGPIFHTCRKPA
jgi:hypothetical protein